MDARTDPHRSASVPADSRKQPRRKRERCKSRKVRGPRLCVCGVGAVLGICEPHPHPFCPQPLGDTGQPVNTSPMIQRGWPGGVTAALLPTVGGSRWGGSHPLPTTAPRCPPVPKVQWPQERIPPVSPSPAFSPPPPSPTPISNMSSAQRTAARRYGGGEKGCGVRDYGGESDRGIGVGGYGV